jgi:outer membrane protein
LTLFQRQTYNASATVRSSYPEGVEFMRATFRVCGLLMLGGLLATFPLAAQQFESVPQAGQTAAAPAPSGGVQIGVINLQMAMTRTAEGQKALGELEARFTPRQQELQKLQDDIRAGDEKLRTQERTLSDDARMELMRDLEQKRKQLNRMQQDLQDEAQNAQTDYINEIGGKMQQVLNRYARENNLSIILNVGAQGGTVLQWSPTVDITQAVIQLYDQTYPVQSAGTPPAAQSKQPPKP